ncbi:MAG TPA: hypothetical protein VN541_12565 [Tepidisphaeraceae bacterium]|nr:hypothetical protein [Tepidisphaeraceae bacterium]
MIQSSRSITLVLISAATVLGAYAAFDEARHRGPATTQPYSSYSGYHGTHYYYHSYGTGRSYGSTGGWSASSHGTSRGGFGAHGGGRGGS